MSSINKEIFVCLDCETTGLDAHSDRIIEVAVSKFNFSGIVDSYESLIDPEVKIPEASQAIHHITEEMVQGKPKIETILPMLIKFFNNHIIVGHGIQLDLAFLAQSAIRKQLPFHLSQYTTIDTLRLARLYGESPTNSLEKLREHFNIKPEGAHRAMSDVTVNIEVFKHLAQPFTHVKELLERLKNPILLKTMPLGKYKGRTFKEIPTEYLSWAAHADFDQDLLFSVKTELKKRKKRDRFVDMSNPFSQL